jgi:hypothetical protein
MEFSFSLAKLSDLIPYLPVRIYITLPVHALQSRVRMLDQFWTGFNLKGRCSLKSENLFLALWGTFCGMTSNSKCSVRCKFLLYRSTTWNFVCSSTGILYSLSNNVVFCYNSDSGKPQTEIIHPTVTKTFIPECSAPLQILLLLVAFCE